MKGCARRKVGILAGAATLALGCSEAGPTHQGAGGAAAGAAALAGVGGAAGGSGVGGAAVVGNAGGGASTVAGNGGLGAAGGALAAGTAGDAAGQNAAGGGSPAVGGGGNAGMPAQGGSGAGGAPSAGVGGTGTAGGAGSSASGPFTLAWEDNFDTLDTSRWALQTFSFDGNLAQFSTENASIANGVLSIALTPEPTDTAKPYRGVELRSVPTVTYGRVEARIRFAKGSGVVSGLVLIYTPWPADDWNEIDIEHLGKQADAAQLNCQVYTGPPTTPPVTQSVSPTQDAELKTLGFDAESDFHVYTLEWTPASVEFKADGQSLRSWTKEIARMKLPQNVLFTIWASSSASWAGALTSDSAPTTADIDWIKVYRWNDPAGSP